MRPIYAPINPIIPLKNEIQCALFLCHQRISFLISSRIWLIPVSDKYHKSFVAPFTYNSCSESVLAPNGGTGTISLLACWNIFYVYKTSYSFSNSCTSKRCSLCRSCLILRSLALINNLWNKLLVAFMRSLNRTIFWDWHMIYRPKT